jgi:hypothetical protein
VSGEPDGQCLRLLLAPLAEPAKLVRITRVGVRMANEEDEHRREHSRRCADARSQ